MSLPERTRKRGRKKGELHKYTQQQWDEAEAHWRMGMKAEAISFITGINHATIRSRAVAHGWSIRHLRGEARKRNSRLVREKMAAKRAQKRLAKLQIVSVKIRCDKCLGVYSAKFDRLKSPEPISAHECPDSASRYDARQRKAA